MNKAKLFDLLDDHERFDLKYHGLEDTYVDVLDMKELLAVGYVLLKSIYGMGPVPSENIVCFAVETLTKRAKTANLSIF